MAWYDFILGKKTGALEVIEKGNYNGAKASEGPAPLPKSWEIDAGDYAFSEMQAALGIDTQEGANGLDFKTLRTMSRIPLISAIINTRINQVAEFCIPQQTPYSLGYRIVLRDQKDDPSPADVKRIEEMTRWVSTCGDTRLGYDNRFETFIRKVLRDSLVFDQACFEVVKTRGGKIAGLLAVDASTIRRAKLSEKEIKSGRYDPAKTGYVQVLSQKKVAEFDSDELVFGVRRPRTWIKSNGYGYPELEELIRVVTNLLNAENFNANNFTHGMHVSGILAVKSKMNPQLFRSFRREFYAMLSGAANAHRTPIIQLDPENKEELQQVNMSQSNKDMEFTSWLSFLLRQACMVYGMDAAELGYQYGNENQTSSMNSGGPGDQLTYSRERGLRPMLRSVQSWINSGVIWKIDPELMIEFVGFDSMSESQKVDLDIKACQNFRTINETRAMYDLEPLESAVGDMIMNASYMNTASMMDAQEGGDEEGAGFEGGDDEGADFGGDDDFDVDKLLSGIGGETEKVQKSLKRKPKITSVTVEVE